MNQFFFLRILVFLTIFSFNSFSFSAEIEKKGASDKVQRSASSEKASKAENTPDTTYPDPDNEESEGETAPPELKSEESETESIDGKDDLVETEAVAAESSPAPADEKISEDNTEEDADKVQGGTPDYKDAPEINETSTIKPKLESKDTEGVEARSVEGPTLEDDSADIAKKEKAKKKSSDKRKKTISTKKEKSRKKKKQSARKKVRKRSRFASRHDRVFRAGFGVPVCSFSRGILEGKECVNFTQRYSWVNAPILFTHRIGKRFRLGGGIMPSYASLAKVQGFGAHFVLEGSITIVPDWLYTGMQVIAGFPLLAAYDVFIGHQMFFKNNVGIFIENHFSAMAIAGFYAYWQPAAGICYSF